jgi:hypothetical protein
MAYTNSADFLNIYREEKSRAGQTQNCESWHNIDLIFHIANKGRAKALHVHRRKAFFHKP